MALSTQTNPSRYQHFSLQCQKIKCLVCNATRWLVGNSFHLSQFQRVLYLEWMECVSNIMTHIKRLFAISRCRQPSVTDNVWLRSVCVHGWWDTETDTLSCNGQRLHWWAWSRQRSKRHEDHSIIGLNEEICAALLTAVSQIREVTFALTTSLLTFWCWNYFFNFSTSCI